MKLSAKSRAIINKNTERLIAECFALLRLPPRMTVSEFAEAERILSPETTAQSGRWRNIPYQIEMQDIFKDPKVNTAIFMTSTQCGKSSLILNILAYCIAHESGANTFMLPSESIARDFSKAQITPLIRDMPIVGNKIRGARKDGNTHLFKAWPGGSLRFVGSQRADKLSSFPSPRLFIDELDCCVRATRNSAGQIEGSPVELLLERNKNWPNRFALLTSTPTIEGASAIAEWWEKSDKRKPNIPCPQCGYYQFLAWEQFEWEGKDKERIEDKPETIRFRCLGCKSTFTESTRNSWLPRLKWVKENPKSDIAGFHLNAFYSPWSKWSELLQKYLAAGSNARGKRRAAGEMRVSERVPYFFYRISRHTGLCCRRIRTPG
jgi:phage terminase large subunit GpA-like protein